MNGYGGDTGEVAATQAVVEAAVVVTDVFSKVKTGDELREIRVKIDADVYQWFKDTSVISQISMRDLLEKTFKEALPKEGFYDN